MGYLYLEIVGQPCLVGNVDQGLMEYRQTDLLDRMTKEIAKTKTILGFSPYRRYPECFSK